MKVGATNFAEKSHMITWSVTCLISFIHSNIWNIELQRNQFLKLSYVIIVYKMTILWQQIKDNKFKIPLFSFLSSLALKGRSTHPTTFTTFFQNEFLCQWPIMQHMPLSLPFSQKTWGCFLFIKIGVPVLQLIESWFKWGPKKRSGKINEILL